MIRNLANMTAAFDSMARLEADPNLKSKANRRILQDDPTDFRSNTVGSSSSRHGESARGGSKSMDWSLDHKFQPKDSNQPTTPSNKLQPKPPSTAQSSSHQSTSRSKTTKRTVKIDVEALKKAEEDRLEDERYAKEEAMKQIRYEMLKVTHNMSKVLRDMDSISLQTVSPAPEKMLRLNYDDKLPDPDELLRMKRSSQASVPNLAPTSATATGSSHGSVTNSKSNTRANSPTQSTSSLPSIKDAIAASVGDDSNPPDNSNTSGGLQPPQPSPTHINLPSMTIEEQEYDEEMQKLIDEGNAKKSKKSNIMQFIEDQTLRAQTALPIEYFTRQLHHKQVSKHIIEVNERMDFSAKQWKRTVYELGIDEEERPPDKPIEGETPAEKKKRKVLERIERMQQQKIEYLGKRRNQILQQKPEEVFEYDSEDLQMIEDELRQFMKTIRPGMVFEDELVGDSGGVDGTKESKTSSGSTENANKTSPQKHRSVHQPPPQPQQSSITSAQNKASSPGKGRDDDDDDEEEIYLPPELQAKFGQLKDRVVHSIRLILRKERQLVKDELRDINASIQIKEQELNILRNQLDKIELILKDIALNEKKIRDVIDSRFRASINQLSDHVQRLTQKIVDTTEEVSGLQKYRFKLMSMFEELKNKRLKCDPFLRKRAYNLVKGLLKNMNDDDLLEQEQREQRLREQYQAYQSIQETQKEQSCQLDMLQRDNKDLQYELETINDRIAREKVEFREKATRLKQQDETITEKLKQLEERMNEYAREQRRKVHLDSRVKSKQRRKSKDNDDGDDALLSNADYLEQQAKKHNLTIPTDEKRKAKQKQAEEKRKKAALKKKAKKRKKKSGSDSSSNSESSGEDSNDDADESDADSSTASDASSSAGEEENKKSKRASLTGEEYTESLRAEVMLNRPVLCDPVTEDVLDISVDEAKRRMKTSQKVAPVVNLKSVNTSSVASEGSVMILPGTYFSPTSTLAKRATILQNKDEEDENKEAKSDDDDDDEEGNSGGIDTIVEEDEDPEKVEEQEGKTVTFSTTNQKPFVPGKFSSFTAINDSESEGTKHDTAAEETEVETDPDTASKSTRRTSVMDLERNYLDDVAKAQLVPSTICTACYVQCVEDFLKRHPDMNFQRDNPRTTTAQRMISRRNSSNAVMSETVMKQTTFQFNLEEGIKVLLEVVDRLVEHRETTIASANVVRKDASKESISTGLGGRFVSESQAQEIKEDLIVMMKMAMIQQLQLQAHKDQLQHKSSRRKSSIGNSMVTKPKEMLQEEEEELTCQLHQHCHKILSTIVRNGIKILLVNNTRVLFSQVLQDIFAIVGIVMNCVLKFWNPSLELAKSIQIVKTQPHQPLFALFHIKTPAWIEVFTKQIIDIVLSYGIQRKEAKLTKKERASMKKSSGKQKSFLGNVTNPNKSSTDLEVYPDPNILFDGLVGLIQQYFIRDNFDVVNPILGKTSSSGNAASNEITPLVQLLLMECKEVITKAIETEAQSAPSVENAMMMENTSTRTFELPHRNALQFIEGFLLTVFQVNEAYVIANHPDKDVNVEEEFVDIRASHRRKQNIGATMLNKLTHYIERAKTDGAQLGQVKSGYILDPPMVNIEEIDEFLVKLAYPEIAPGLIAINVLRRVVEEELLKRRFLQKIAEVQSDVAELQFLNVAMPTAAEVLMHRLTHDSAKEPTVDVAEVAQNSKIVSVPLSPVLGKVNKSLPTSPDRPKSKSAAFNDSRANSASSHKNDESRTNSASSRVFDDSRITTAASHAYDGGSSLLGTEPVLSPGKSFLMIQKKSLAPPDAPMVAPTPTITLPLSLTSTSHNTQQTPVKRPTISKVNLGEAITDNSKFKLDTRDATNNAQRSTLYFPSRASDIENKDATSPNTKQRTTTIVQTTAPTAVGNSNATTSPASGLVLPPMPKMPKSRQQIQHFNSMEDVHKVWLNDMEAYIDHLCQRIVTVVWASPSTATAEPSTIAASIRKKMEKLLGGDNALNENGEAKSKEEQAMDAIIARKKQDKTSSVPLPETLIHRIIGYVEQLRQIAHTRAVTASDTLTKPSLLNEFTFITTELRRIQHRIVHIIQAMTLPMRKRLIWLNHKYHEFIKEHLEMEQHIERTQDQTSQTKHDIEEYKRSLAIIQHEKHEKKKLEFLQQSSNKMAKFLPKQVANAKKRAPTPVSAPISAPVSAPSTEQQPPADAPVDAGPAVQTTNTISLLPHSIQIQKLILQHANHELQQKHLYYQQREAQLQALIDKLQKQYDELIMHSRGLATAHQDMIVHRNTMNMMNNRTTRQSAEFREFESILSNISFDAHDLDDKPNHMEAIVNLINSTGAGGRGADVAHMGVKGMHLAALEEHHMHHPHHHLLHPQHPQHPIHAPKHSLLAGAMPGSELEYDQEIGEIDPSIGSASIHSTLAMTDKLLQDYQMKQELSANAALASRGLHGSALSKVIDPFLNRPRLTDLLPHYVPSYQSNTRFTDSDVESDDGREHKRFIPLSWRQYGGKKGRQNRLNADREKAKRLKKKKEEDEKKLRGRDLIDFYLQEIQESYHHIESENEDFQQSYILGQQKLLPQYNPFDRSGHKKAPPKAVKHYMTNTSSVQGVLKNKMKAWYQKRYDPHTGQYKGQYLSWAGMERPQDIRAKSASSLIATKKAPVAPKVMGFANSINSGLWDMEKLPTSFHPPVEDVQQMQGSTSGSVQTPRIDTDEPDFHSSVVQEGLSGARNFLFYLGGDTFDTYSSLDMSERALVEKDIEETDEDDDDDDDEEEKENEEVQEVKVSADGETSINPITKTEKKKDPTIKVKGKDVKKIFSDNSNRSKRVYLQRLDRKRPFHFLDLDNVERLQSFTPLNIAKSMDVEHLQSTQQPPQPPADGSSPQANEINLNPTIPTALNDLPATMDSSIAKVSFNLGKDLVVDSRKVSGVHGKGFPQFLLSLPGQNSNVSSANNSLIRLSTSGSRYSGSGSSSQNNSRGNTQLRMKSILEGGGEEVENAVVHGNIRRRKQYSGSTTTSVSNDSSKVEVGASQQIDPASIALPTLDDAEDFNGSEVVDSDSLHASFRQFTFTLDQDILNIVRQVQKNRAAANAHAKAATQPQPSPSTIPSSSLGFTVSKLQHRTKSDTVNKKKMLQKKASLLNRTMKFGDKDDEEFEGWQKQILTWLNQNANDNAKQDPFYRRQQVHDNMYFQEYDDKSYEKPQIGTNVHYRGSIFNLFPEAAKIASTSKMSSAAVEKEVVDFKDIEVFHNEVRVSFDDVEHYAFEEVQPALRTSPISELQSKSAAGSPLNIDGTDKYGKMKKATALSSPSDKVTQQESAENKGSPSQAGSMVMPTAPTVVENMARSRLTTAEGNPGNSLGNSRVASRVGTAKHSEPNNREAVITEASLASKLSSTYHSAMFEYLHATSASSLSQQRPPSEPKPSASFMSPRRAKASTNRGSVGAPGSAGLALEQRLDALMAKSEHHPKEVTDTTSTGPSIVESVHDEPTATTTLH